MNGIQEVRGSTPLGSTSTDEARETRLIYAGDDEPGITRHRSGRGFSYRHPDGRLVRDPPTLDRIKRIGIPPAYDDVWIANVPRSHILATGRDERGRKQYRYHPDWSTTQGQRKFERLLSFGAALPMIRERALADMGKPGLRQEKVLALVVRLLETTLIRVGNQEYARANRSYGLTTLRSRHLDIEGTSLRFSFKGKSGQQHDVSLRDRRLAGVMRKVQELPGQTVFQYLDADGARQPVTSTEVNDYLRAIAGEEFSAKDYRTWAATALAAWSLRCVEPAASPTAAKRQANAVIRDVARRLGNTMAICRSSYVHPMVLQAYTNGELARRLPGVVTADDLRAWESLIPHEPHLLEFLRSATPPPAPG